MTEKKLVKLLEAFEDSARDKRIRLLKRKEEDDNS
jgi:hypothetical protein